MYTYPLRPATPPPKPCTPPSPRKSRPRERNPDSRRPTAAASPGPNNVPQEGCRITGILSSRRQPLPSQELSRTEASQGVFSHGYTFLLETLPPTQPRLRSRQGLQHGHFRQRRHPPQSTPRRLPSPHPT